MTLHNQDVEYNMATFSELHAVCIKVVYSIASRNTLEYGITMVYSMVVNLVQHVYLNLWLRYSSMHLNLSLLNASWSDALTH